MNLSFYLTPPQVVTKFGGNRQQIQSYLKLHVLPRFFQIFSDFFRFFQIFSGNWGIGESGNRVDMTCTPTGGDKIRGQPPADPVVPEAPCAAPGRKRAPTYQYRALAAGRTRRLGRADQAQARHSTPPDGSRPLRAMRAAGFERATGGEHLRSCQPARPGIFPPVVVSGV